MPEQPIDALVPPTAKQVPHTWVRPTGEVSDPWAWLRDRDDADTVAYLEAENAYAAAWLAPHEPLVQTVFDEIKSRVQETDTAVPVRKGPWWYTARTVEGLDYPIHCRGPQRDTADEHVLLDENVEAAGHDYFHLGLFELDPAHRVVAWSSDVDGSELYTLRFRDLATGAELDDVVEGTSAWGGAAWSSDGRDFFYMMPDDQMRPFEVWRHRLGTPQSDDVCVLREDDERCYLGIELTRSERWIVIESASKTSSEVRLLAADQPDAAPRLVRPRTDDLEYSFDHWGDRFVVLTNLDAEDFRVMTAPEDAPDVWTELLPHVPGQRIVGIEPFATHLAVHEWSNAQQRVRIVRRDGTVETLDLGDELGVLGQGLGDRCGGVGPVLDGPLDTVPGDLAAQCLLRHLRCIRAELGDELAHHLVRQIDRAHRIKGTPRRTRADGELPWSGSGTDWQGPQSGPSGGRGRVVARQRYRRASRDHGRQMTLTPLRP